MNSPITYIFFLAYTAYMSNIPIEKSLSTDEAEYPTSSSSQLSSSSSHEPEHGSPMVSENSEPNCINPCVGTVELPVSPTSTKVAMFQKSPLAVQDVELIHEHLLHTNQVISRLVSNNIIPSIPTGLDQSLTPLQLNRNLRNARRKLKRVPRDFYSNNAVIAKGSYLMPNKIIESSDSPGHLKNRFGIQQGILANMSGKITHQISELNSQKFRYSSQTAAC